LIWGTNIRKPLGFDREHPWFPVKIVLQPIQWSTRQNLAPGRIHPSDEWG
jgi:hypothetical protein